jgi:hypothetical protein
MPQACVAWKYVTQGVLPAITSAYFLGNGKRLVVLSLQHSPSAEHGYEDSPKGNLP